ncbi:hypothetical protein AJ78_07895 [Emergomyces pasteurianus Ep9510]|uniref:Uncharacterized protein n=1 Tax=Emergomyces pasteurianus Ep9510 TaxID=1447872 RepID=A0A1J9Q802_9EURO|nr:hypothetical protein AJ78_07895 [Emergomyces pasteurianus Ep9510]
MFGQTNPAGASFTSRINEFFLSASAVWTAACLLAQRSFFKISIIFASLFLLLVCFAAFYNPPTFRHPTSPFANPQWDRTPPALESKISVNNDRPLATPSPLPSPLPSPTATKASFTKPANLKIVAVIFYGRPDRVEILDCYLKRNLVVNGGWIDEVYWAPNTEKQADLEWLDKLVPTSPLYKKIQIEKKRKGYARIWDSAITDPDTLYIKVDDDIVYIDDNAIPKLVSLKLEHDHSFLVSANVINSAPLPYHHYRTGAVRPYLPEMTAPNNITNNSDASQRKPTWRASQLPYWEGPDDFQFPLDVGNAPYPNHRWLPVHDENGTAIYRTPMHNALCSPWKENRGKWSLAAQQHFSLFESLEQDAMDVYDFARRGVWDMGFERISINFIAIWGRDVIDHLPLNDDEAMLTMAIPKKLRRPVLVATGALASHYAFASQAEDLKNTDILSRYRAYANDLICPGTLA